MRDYSVLNGMIENQKSELRTAYDKGYNQGVKDFDLILATSKKEEEGYNRGLEDAWACCKRFMNSDNKVCDKIFGVSGWVDFLDQSPSDAIEKFKEYDEKTFDAPDNCKIEVGDEVRNSTNNHIGIVVKNVDENSVKIISSWGNTGIWELKNCNKTGKCFKDFAERLLSLQDDE